MANLVGKNRKNTTRKVESGSIPIGHGPTHHARISIRDWQAWSVNRSDRQRPLMQDRG